MKLSEPLVKGNRYFAVNWSDEIRDYHTNFDGNSNAYSAGISWTQDLTDNLGYSLGANYHNYKFDMSGSSAQRDESGNYPFPIEVSDVSITEKLFTLTASLFYRF